MHVWSFLELQTMGLLRDCEMKSLNLRLKLYYWSLHVPGVDPDAPGHVETHGLVGDHVDVEPLVGLPVHALLELAHEEVDADDGEDEPEDDADGHHVGDAGQGADQGGYHHLHTLHLGHGSQWSQRSQGSHCFEDGNISEAFKY